MGYQRFDTDTMKKVGFNSPGKYWKPLQICCFAEKVALGQFYRGTNSYWRKISRLISRGDGLWYYVHTLCIHKKRGFSLFLFPDIKLYQKSTAEKNFLYLHIFVNNCNKNQIAAKIITGKK